MQVKNHQIKPKRKFIINVVAQYKVMMASDDPSPSYNSEYNQLYLVHVGTRQRANKPNYNGGPLPVPCFMC
jgi:hypothetical protein